MIAYLAASLFTTAERRFNEELAAAIISRCNFIDIILPQRIATEAAGAPDFHTKMFRHAMEAIERCDFVVAVLDGADADSGTCVELGYARARAKPILGIRTDLRGSEDRGLNLMVSHVCTALILSPSTSTSLDDLVEAIARAVELLRHTK